MSKIDERIIYLESLLPKIVKDRKGNEMTVEEKYRERFEKYARYEENGVYQWQGLRATDTAILFLSVVLRSEQIEFKQE